MRVFHVDRSTKTDVGVSEFAGAAEIQIEPKVDFDVINETVRRLKAAGDGVALVFAHGSPTAADLRSRSADFSSWVIRIGLSKDAPALVVADGYVGRVAAFEWLPEAGAGLGGLGAALRPHFVAGSPPSAQALLAAVQEYFRAEFDRDDLLAAYLFRLVSPTSDAYAERLSQVGLGEKFANLDAPELLAALRSKM